MSAEASRRVAVPADEIPKNNPPQQDETPVQVARVSTTSQQVLKVLGENWRLGVPSFLLVHGVGRHLATGRTLFPAAFMSLMALSPYPLPERRIQQIASDPTLNWLMNHSAELLSLAGLCSIELEALNLAKGLMASAAAAQLALVLNSNRT